LESERKSRDSIFPDRSPSSRRVKRDSPVLRSKMRIVPFRNPIAMMSIAGEAERQMIELGVWSVGEFRSFFDLLTGKMEVKVWMRLL
jgi:hypothetical protein